MRLSDLIRRDMTREDTDVKMRFNDFVFPANPAELEIALSTNFSLSPVIGKGSNVQNVSVNAAVIKGRGEFYGSKAEEACHYLQHMLKLKKSGTLLLPSSSSFDAYLTEFTFKRNAEKNCISYSFVFVESSNNKNEHRRFCCTTAGAGENAFAIANRCDVSVSEIMRNNPFKTPFDIREGDRVVLK